MVVTKDFEPQKHRNHLFSNTEHKSPFNAFTDAYVHSVNYADWFPSVEYKYKDNHKYKYNQNSGGCRVMPPTSFSLPVFHVDPVFA